MAIAKVRASEGNLCLETWKNTYFDVRKKIEQSGRDARWEFDQKKLFERSNYIAQVCSDIYSVAQVCRYILIHMYILIQLGNCVHKHQYVCT